MGKKPHSWLVAMPTEPKKVQLVHQTDSDRL